MSIHRITISVPTDVARRIKKAAGKGSVSAWVTEALEERLADAELERLWDAFYADVAPGRADVRRADAILAKITGPSATSVAESDARRRSGTKRRAGRSKGAA